MQAGQWESLWQTPSLPPFRTTERAGTHLVRIQGLESYTQDTKIETEQQGPVSVPVKPEQKKRWYRDRLWRKPEPGGGRGSLDLTKV